MKKSRKTILWAALAVMMMGLFSCGEKEPASRYTEVKLLGTWRYYTMVDTIPVPGITLKVMQKNAALVDGDPMRWNYEGDVFSAQREEGNVIHWLRFKVMEIDEANGMMMVNGAHGFCENVAGTEWDVSRMEGHSWRLEQPGFFAKI